MNTKVIMRADDITGERIKRLGAWFERHHPSIPCSAFAFKTDEEWPQEFWGLTRDLITEHQWEIGGHSVTHPMLSTLSESEIREEIKTNKRDIEDGLSSVGCDYSVESFAYPTGAYDDRVISVLKEEGFEYGLTYPDGFPYQSAKTIPSGEDRYRWGITHNAFLGLEEWNDRFDRVHNTDSTNVYVLCFHPQWWWDTSNEPESIRMDLKTGWATEKWDELDDHLRYIETKDNVDFTTFRDCS